MSDLINSEWDLNYVAKCLVLISNRYWTFLHLMIRYETIGWLAGKLFFTKVLNLLWCSWFLIDNKSGWNIRMIIKVGKFSMFGT